MSGISSNMGAGLDPLLQAGYTTEVNTTRAPGSDNTWITGSLGSMNGSGRSSVYTNLANYPSLVALQDPININQQGSKWSLDDSPYEQPDKKTEVFNLSIAAELIAQYEEGGMSPTQAAQVKYYLLHPQENPPSTIKELVDKTLSGATSRYIQENNLAPDWKPTLNEDYNSKMYDLAAGTAWDAAFEAVIKDKPNAAQLRYEHYNRSAGSPLTAEEKTALTNIQGDYGMPDTFIPEADKKGFIEQTNIDYTTNFSTLVKNQSPPLSESDQAKLEYMLYHPDAEVSADLKAKFAKFSSEAAVNTSKQSGIPENASFTFQANSKPYDAKLNGFFGEFQQNRYEAFVAQNAVAPWTEDSQVLLKQYLNGTTTTVPDFIKAAAESIRQQAISDIQGEFHLEGIAWSPVAPGTFPPVNPVTQSILNETEDFLKIAQQNVSGMPEGPGKTIMLNILMRISQALTELKAAIYESLGGDSSKSRDLARAKLDLALSSIKEQMEGAKETSEKQKKAGDLGNGVNIINAIMSFFTIIVSVVGGPVAMAFAIMNFIDAVDPNAKCIEKMMTGISDVVGDALGALGADETTKKVFQQAAKMAVIVAICVCSYGVAAVLTGPKLIELSGIVRDISVAAGASKEDAEKANKYFAVALGLAITVATIIVGTVLTLGIGTGPLIMAGIAQTTATIMKVVSIAQQVISLALQAISTGLTIGRSVILSEVAILQGFLASKKVLNDAEIQEIMKLIKKLLAAINGAAEFLGDITDSQKNLHANAIQSIAGLGTAG